MEHGGKFSTPSHSKDNKQLRFDIKILEGYFESKCVQIHEKRNELSLNFSIFKSGAEDTSESDTEEHVSDSDGEYQNKGEVLKQKMVSKFQKLESKGE